MYWNGVYYPNWRIYRDQPPVSLNYDVISHVFYAFAWYAKCWIELLGDRANTVTG